ncbi:hypothetical protein CCACVL1_10298 [Corchorus capsularis]|uniref:Uncharacterized protein n=1 Tax=Corchorus capsularis TaxID=210143 RepID=A0A1R3IRZ3_COCAP|nr:hypothetical protein CCACVL1_10298 [Corchorus capsularis]
MAQKMKTKKNKKQAQGHPPKEEADNIDVKTVTWPDFPQTLVNIIAKQPALMQSELVIQHFFSTEQVM